MKYIFDEDRVLNAKLNTARTASAAWKAKCKQKKKRVAELEEAIVPLLEELTLISEGYFDTERYYQRITTIAKARRALNK